MYEDLGDWHVENRLLEQGWEAGRPFRRQIQVKDDGSQTIWLDQIWEKHLVEEMLSLKCLLNISKKSNQIDCLVFSRSMSSCPCGAYTLFI